MFKEETNDEWEDMDEDMLTPSTKEDITTLTAINHIYSVKSLSFNSDLLKKNCDSYGDGQYNNRQTEKVIFFYFPFLF